MKHSINRKTNPLTRSNRPRLRQGLTASRRKQWGNTLVPVVLGIAIASVATVSFLNQGADLRIQTNRQVAITHLANITSEYQVARDAGIQLPLITNVNVPSLAGANPFGGAIQLADPADGVRVLTYVTDSVGSCQLLQPLFPVAGRITASTCGDPVSATLSLTLN